MHFLVYMPAISAQTWRYHRFVTGTIVPTRHNPETPRIKYFNSNPPVMKVCY